MTEPQTDSYDVVPESESDLISDNESFVFDAQQAKMMHDQMLLRASCIENGEDGEKFLKSNFGLYLLGQADLNAEQAKEQLCDVDPVDTKTIMKLQNRIKRYRDVESWIRSAIDQGESEYNDYLQSQSTNDEV